MSKLTKTLAIALTGIGLAVGGSLLSAGSAEAAPGGGFHRGGHGHFHHGHRGHWRGDFRRPGYWRPAYLAGPVLVGGYGPRCRLVERVNRWGDIVVRRVCRY